MSGVIVGGWTHRRGDAGGTRSLVAELSGARPANAWSWEPPPRSRIDQVRIAGDHVYVATLEAADPAAPGWEHAVIFALEASSGRVVAARTLPDPAPVAAMAVEAGVVHLVATRPGEPVFRYALGAPDLAPMQRRMLDLEGDGRKLDVLDAWATPDGGLWLEVESVQRGARAYTFVSDEGEPRTAVLGHALGTADAASAAPCDACCVGRSLFVPAFGEWSEQKASPPALLKLDPERVSAPERRRAIPRRVPWAKADLVGPDSREHTLAAEGTVSAIAIAADPERPERARVQAMALDQASGTVRWQTAVAPMASTTVGSTARVLRRGSGELVMQRLDDAGTPCSDLLCARQGEAMDVVTLGTRRKYVLDAALGDELLAHYEKSDGRVVLGAFAVGDEERLFGRRAKMLFTVETPNAGGGSIVYAGASRIVVRGDARIFALRV